MLLKSASNFSFDCVQYVRADKNGTKTAQISHTIAISPVLYGCSYLQREREREEEEISLHYLALG